MAELPVTPSPSPERRALRAAGFGLLAVFVLVGGLVGWQAYRKGSVRARIDELETRLEALRSDARSRAVELPVGLGEPAAINLFPHAAAAQATIDALERPHDGLPNTLPVDLQLAGLAAGQRSRLMQLEQRALTAERAWSTEHTTLPEELAVAIRRWLVALAAERTEAFDTCAQHAVAALRYGYALDAVADSADAEALALDELEPAIARCAAGAPREARHQAADALWRLADERVPPAEAIVGVLNQAELLLERAKRGLQDAFSTGGQAADVLDMVDEQLDDAAALIAHRGPLESFEAEVPDGGRLIHAEQRKRLWLRLSAAVLRAGAAPGDAQAIEGMRDPVAGPIVVEDGEVRALRAESLVMGDGIRLATGPSSGGTPEVEGSGGRGSGAAGDGRPGALSKEVIRRAIRANIASVQSCYQAELVHEPTLEGRIDVRILIAPDGTVQNALVYNADIDIERMESCVTAAVRQLRFPAPDGGGMVIVNYPFTFAPR